MCDCLKYVGAIIRGMRRHVDNNVDDNDGRRRPVTSWSRRRVGRPRVAETSLPPPPVTRGSTFAPLRCLPPVFFLSRAASLPPFVSQIFFSAPLRTAPREILPPPPPLPSPSLPLLLLALSQLLVTLRNLHRRLLLVLFSALSPLPPSPSAFREPRTISCCMAWERENCQSRVVLWARWLNHVAIHSCTILLHIYMSTFAPLPLLASHPLTLSDPFVSLSPVRAPIPLFFPILPPSLSLSVFDSLAQRTSMNETLLCGVVDIRLQEYIVPRFADQNYTITNV